MASYSKCKCGITWSKVSDSKCLKCNEHTNIPIPENSIWPKEVFGKYCPCRSTYTGARASCAACDWIVNVKSKDEYKDYKDIAFTYEGKAYNSASKQKCNCSMAKLMSGGCKDHA